MTDISLSTSDSVPRDVDDMYIKVLRNLYKNEHITVYYQDHVVPGITINPSARNCRAILQKVVDFYSEVSKL